jgi:hypothetical protein
MKTYANICNMTNCSVSANFLIYVKCFKQKFYNAYVLSNSSNKKKITLGNTSKEGKH